MAHSDPTDVDLPIDVTIRPLRDRDIAQACRLSQEAGWNQTAEDWQVFLELGTVDGLASSDGELIATAAMMPYGGRFAWIGMVLVTSRHRRRGLATWLLRHCVAALQADRLVPILDATPSGRQVYSTLGFEDTWSISRLVAHTIASSRFSSISSDVTVRRLNAVDWPMLIAHDREIFGADRSRLLRHLAARLPQASLVAERNGRLAGCLLGRDGRVMTQLGPLTAENDDIAQALLARAISELSPPLAVDIADHHHSVAAWLADIGFARERPFTRMVYRRNTAFDNGAHLFAITGPEFG